MTTNTSPDAVEALNAALAYSNKICDFKKGAPEEVMQHLHNQGFTIAPIGVAKQPETQSVPALTRQPAMTDAELEREAAYLWRTAKVGHDITDEIIELAKKYRG